MELSPACNGWCRGWRASCPSRPGSAGPGGPIVTGLGATIYQRLDRLGRISAEPDRLTRVFMSPEQRQASALVMDWMREAGMAARIDAIGNVVGRIEGDRPGLPCLMLGSHLDTVRNAGRYDGMLGVVTAIACVAELGGTSRDFAIEVVGFSDEEGTRFGAPLLGSRALAGTFDPALLDLADAEGVTMRRAIAAYGLDPGRIAEATRRRDEILAYVELHIEQGPVLERLGLPLGCVTGISGSSRLKVALSGVAGHAGTVPMDGRQDALAGAAECVLAVESACSGVPGLVGTVGMIQALPGAINVVPGGATFTIDLRAPEDATRKDALARLVALIEDIARHRGLGLKVETVSESPAAPCAPWLITQVHAAIATLGLPVHDLPSGAGHDGMAICAIADIGMIFVRCAGGVSHNPAEAITVEDADLGARALLSFIKAFRAKG